MNFLARSWAPFATTQWTVILAAAGQPDAPETRSALETLYRTYWAPVFGFIRRQGHSTVDAEDLTQDFFLYLLDQDACAKADRDQGKFRSFLLAWLKNFLATTSNRANRVKRGGGQALLSLHENPGMLKQLETESLTIHPPGDEEQHFDWLWASTLVRQATETLAAEYATGPRARIFQELKPFLLGGQKLPDQTEVAGRLGMPVETLRSHLSRLRARYRRVLREEVLQTLPPGADVDEELRYLSQVLIAALPNHP